MVPLVFCFFVAGVAFILIDGLIDNTLVSLTWTGLLIVGTLGTSFLTCLFCNKAVRAQNQLRKEHEERERLFQVYHNVIEALTQNPLTLLTPTEYDLKFGQEQPLLSLPIREVEDIRRCRQEVDEFLKDKLPKWTKSVSHRVLLCVSEAVTNVIKHTPGGRLDLIIEGNNPRFHIIDKGSGLDLNKLPYLLFLKGYSTEDNSIGYGFPIIIRYMSKVLVCTSKAGTKLVLYPDLEKLAERLGDG